MKRVLHVHRFVKWDPDRSKRRRRAVSSTALTLYEGEDLLILLFGLTLLHEVDLILQDEDVLQLHDLYGSQMLGCLRLRTWLVAR